MKIAYLADIRAPTAQSWISYFVEAGHSVDVIASYPVDEGALPSTLSGAKLHVVPLALTGVLGGGREASQAGGRLPRADRLLNLLRGSTAARAATFLRHWVGPVDLVRKLGPFRRFMAQLEPDLFHAMRLPFEGNFAGMVGPSAPLVLSTWGNDLILWARKYPLTRILSRKALANASGLHSDCQRDLKLGREWGFPQERPGIVVPTGGGVAREHFRPGEPDARLIEELEIPEGSPVVVNPRGLRLYVRSDTFFRSIPLVLEKRPDAIFVAPAMRGNVVAERWITRLGIQKAVRLLPAMTRIEIADLFRLADVTISLGEHDGTPNSLLEAMACGSFPVVADTDSIREWITQEENGLLCDAARPTSVAEAILRALEDRPLRDGAAAGNQALIEERADYQKLMPAVEAFYKDVIGRRGNNG